STSNSNQISVADVDVLEGSGQIQVALSASSGVVTLSTLNNITVNAGANTSSAITFTGTITDVNVALSGLVYQPVMDFNGPETLNVSVSDLGNTGSMAPGLTELTDSGAVTISVGAVNDAPENSVPGNQSTDEDIALVFSPTSMVPNGITISDVDAGTDPVEVLLSVTSGALTLGGTSGLDFGQASGDSDGSDGTLRFQGSITDINAALDGLTVLTDLNFTGTAVLTVTTNDLGNSGAGGSQGDADTVQITVNPLNDRPVAVADTYTVQQGQTLTVNDTAGLDGEVNNDSVLLNDSDPDGDGLIAILDTPPANHSTSFSLAGDGTFTYVHNGSAALTDSFIYQVSDGPLSSDPVTVTIAINVPPSVSGATFAIDENSPNGTVVGSVSASDANLDTLSYDISAGNTGTAFTIDSNGQITVDDSSAVDFEANSVFSLVVDVSDGNGGTTSAAVTVNLNDLSEAIAISASELPANGLTIVRSGSKVRMTDTVTGLDVRPAHEIASISSFSVTGRDSLDDTLTIDFSSGNPVPATGLSFAGGVAGNDDLVLLGGSATTVAHTFASASSGSVDVDGAVVSYSGLEPISDSLTAQTRTFTYGAAVDVVTVEDIGTANDGMVRISSAGTSESVDFAVPAVEIEVILGAGSDQLTAASLDGNFLGTFSVQAGDGADTIDASGLTTSTSLTGGSGNDDITGGTGADFILGDGGNDVISGGNGNDTVFGGSGADVLSGGDGVNQLHGQGTSFDRILENVTGTIVLTSSSSQTFSLTWGAGHSNLLRKDELIELIGSSGADSFDLSGFDDGIHGVTVRAGDGDDSVIGSAQADLLEGEAGDDTVRGGDGADFIDLGAGDDLGSGENGSDEILGGDGDDNLQGGNQADILDPGDTGPDDLSNPTDALDLVNGGGSAGDVVRVDLSGAVTFTGKIIPRNGTGGVLINRVEKLVINGSAGDDNFDFRDYFGGVTLFAGSGDDTYLGTSQGDVVYGEDGDDVLDGFGGNDYFLGGAGNDALRGGDGNDIIVGDTGDDVMLGGAGNDFLLGSGGNDTALGEAGSDVIRGQGSADTVAGGGNGNAAEAGDLLLIDGVDDIDEAFSFDFDSLF
ncbi:MAG: Ig-like domain-containing protein, partial [Planctomycetaceae bacterium]